ncbi:FAD:protein FMN transferase [Collimonas sp.]|jgi:thiamine biosynthesis lipoprotein|uniref:FAD:protein FMN transferase n=1 Tax=Collimonas sp. TaxID=1963772 RepID=UPI002C3C96F8|nr:FAD:protein FMN transferase [Collimonas sp.]HWW04542.1 FAD:protein FMN transferase [Collimonas sp.]
MRRRAQPWLGTLVEVTIADTLSEAAAALAFDAAFGAIAEVHRLMSYHDAASDVSKINQMAVGSALQIHARTATVMRAALDMNAVTDGLFDIACASRLVEWGYLPRAGLESGLHQGLARHQRNRPALHIDADGNLQKLAPVLIDLGGIAKGYAVDAAIDALQASGVAAACVNAGGDLRVYGETAFPIMIRDPRAPTQIGFRFDLKDAALATSGSYFSQRTVQGQPRSALVHGVDGSAVVNNISVTVQAPACMTADALTKLVLLSADPRHPLLQQFGATAFII